MQEVLNITFTTFYGATDMIHKTSESMFGQIQTMTCLTVFFSFLSLAEKDWFISDFFKKILLGSSLVT